LQRPEGTLAGAGALALGQEPKLLPQLAHTTTMREEREREERAVRERVRVPTRRPNQPNRCLKIRSSRSSSRRPLNPCSNTIVVARTEGLHVRPDYWVLCIVQGLFPVAPSFVTGRGAAHRHASLPRTHLNHCMGWRADGGGVMDMAARRGTHRPSPRGGR
jgi:hypothetical protein